MSKQKYLPSIVSVIIYSILFCLLIGVLVVLWGLHEKKKDQGDPGQYFTDELYQHVEAMETVFDIGPIYENCDSDFCSDIVFEMFNQHPEFFWLSGEVYFDGYCSDKISEYKITLGTTCDITLVPDMRRRFESEVEKIVATANAEYSSDYEKALYVHDYLVNICVYDEVAAEKYEIGGENIATLANTPYGALCSRKAVCDGYAKAYMLILNRLGIECGIITGTAGNVTSGRGPHAWNYMKLEDGYYLVDVTWDDPCGYGTDVLRHDYFCISSVGMLREHTPGADQFVPTEYGTKYLQ